jgi:uncharacterized oxidoreductase
MKLSGNTILITGGTSGIGFEMAKQFLKHGNKVIITGRNKQKLQSVKEQLSGVITLHCDAGNFDDIAKLHQQIESDYPELNVLINNAGIMRKVNLQSHQHSAAELTGELDINVKGPIWMVDSFLLLLKQNTKLKMNKDVAIVNVSSGLAFVPLPISPIYCATKAALHFYTLALREQLRNTDIKVFELAPPATKTELLGTFSQDDMKGTSIMSAEDMVGAFLNGLSNDKYEICPGQSSQLKFMSRFFPNFILKQLSKNIDAMHAS